MSLNIQLETGYQQIAGNGKPAAESVLYYTTKATFPVTGESEKLYVDKSTGEIFTWNTSLTKYIASGITSADGISYDNTTSGLTAEVIQDAIDETVSKINDMELFKFPNATIIGAPTINNGQVSGFSASNYMKFPFIVNMQGRPFTIDIAFTTGTDITNQQNIIDGIDHGIAFAIRSGKFIIVLGSKTEEWDISGGEKVSSVAVQSQTTYRVRISWDGSVYKFEYSTNGESYTEDTTMRVSSSLSLFPTQINIGVTSGLGGIFSGIINMNYCSLTISDKVVWTGMDDVGLATRMAVDMSNIDEAGVEKVKSIIGDLPTKESLGLDNVTNDKQVKGLSTGTTAGHLVSWGSDGYTVADTGAKIISADINAEANKDNVPTAQLVLDSFTKKVTTETADNNTRIITVPENTDCFAGIGMIGGKTVKYNLFGGFTEMGSYIVSTETYNDHPCYYSNSAWMGASDNELTLKPGKTYTISVMVKASKDDSPYVFYGNVSSGSVRLSEQISISKANTWIKLSTRFTPTANTGRIRIECVAENITTTISEFMVTESNETLLYQPPNTLYNAPVEKVVLTGANILNLDRKNVITGSSSTQKKQWDFTEDDVYIGIATNGYFNSANINFYTIGKDYVEVSTKSNGYGVGFPIKVKSNTTYYVGTENLSNTIYAGFGFYDNDGNWISDSENTIAAVRAITTPNNCSWLLFNARPSTNSGVVRYTKPFVSEVDSYTPYSKTTINLSDIYGNLEEVFPDYGIEGNYIDFENGIYHHKRTKDNPFKNNTWSYNTTLSAFFTEATVKNLNSADYSLITITPMSDKTMAVNNLDNVPYWATRVAIKDEAYGTNIENFTEAVRKKEFEYELTNEELIPLSSIIPPIHVEPNGTIEFINEHNLDVPSKTIYKKTV